MITTDEVLLESIYHYRRKQNFYRQPNDFGDKKSDTIVKLSKKRVNELILIVCTVRLNGYIRKCWLHHIKSFQVQHVPSLDDNHTAFRR